MIGIGIGIRKIIGVTTLQATVLDGYFMSTGAAYYGSNNINSYTYLETDLSYDTAKNGQYTQPAVSTTCQLIFDSIQLSDYSIISASNVTLFSSNSIGRMIKWNTDGTVDFTFNSGGSGFDNSSYRLAKLSDDSFFVGGQFTTYNGVSANRIIKLEADGSIDFSFNYGTGFNNVVRDIIYDKSRGIIWVVGNFSSYNGTSVGNVVGLNIDGSLAYYNSGSGSNHFINNLYVSSDALFVTGGFTSWNGVSVPNYLIKLDIATGLPVNTTFQTGMGTGLTGGNQAIGIAYNPTRDEIVVGGTFTGYDGLSEPYIIGLSLDDASYNNYPQGQPNNYVRIVEYLGKTDEIMLGGAFTTYTGGGGGARLQLISASGTGAPNTNNLYNVSGNCNQEPQGFIEILTPAP